MLPRSVPKLTPGRISFPTNCKGVLTVDPLVVWNFTVSPELFFIVGIPERFLIVNGSKNLM